MDMNTLGIIGLVAGIVSVLLAIVAIWQAMYFFCKGKKTETDVSTALKGIQAQVDTLQSVNTKITDRLTRYVTSPRNDSIQASDLLATTISSLPDIALKLMPPSQSTSDAVLRTEITLAYVGMWHYIGSTNVWASFSLPSPEEFTVENTWHSLCKQTLDQTATDFKYMSGLISQLDQEEIQSPDFQYSHLYNEVIHNFKPLVGDTSEHFARMSKSKQ